MKRNPITSVPECENIAKLSYNPRYCPFVKFLLQARDNMKLFLMAGSETTASSIPVLVYLLTTVPQVQVGISSLP